MAFTDNPLISSLMSTVGLGGILPSMSAPAAHSAPNVPMYRDRPFIPGRMEGLRASGNPASGVPASPTAAMQPLQPGQTPDASNPPIPTQGDLDAVQNGQTPPSLAAQQQASAQMTPAQQLLNHYGVSAPSNIDNHLFIHDPQAFAKHPLIAGMLENGLQGLAYAHPGGNFLESLIGGVRGMQEAQSAKSQYENAQIMNPIAQANSIANLDNQYQRGQLQSAEATRDNAWQSIMQQNASNREQYQNAHLAEQQQAAALQAQLRQAQTDPTRMLESQYITQAKQELANQKYGGDVTKLNSGDLLGIQHHLMQQNSIDKAAGGRSVKATRGAGTSNTAGKVSGADQLQDRQLATQQQELEQELRAVQGKPVISVNGQYVVSSAPAAQAYINGLAAQRNRIAQQRQSIVDKYTGGASHSAAPASTQYSPNNPFAH